MFGQNLAKLRKERKLSQYDLAEKMNFSRGKIANYEQGTRQPDFETLQMFADFFDVSTDFLLGRTDTPNINSKNSEPSLQAWLRQENTDLSESERDELGSEIEDYLAVRKQRILEKRNGK
ncbi:helix-turn-helix domain-containing protein [Lysinibacillus sp. NPDC093692]|uniref:helix-turn-helix domain-containing protein n=1 Tax=Lysinibacillus sp. NPDC093692 TaxID=3390578 RepID=UPI003D05CECC